MWDALLRSPSRLLLLDLLSQGEKPVETLADQAQLSVSNASNHLTELREAALVRTRRDRQRIYYRLASPTAGKLLRSLQGVAHEHLAEVRELIREYHQDRDAFEPIPSGSSPPEQAEMFWDLGTGATLSVSVQARQGW